MPIVRIGQKLVLFAHVPKCGGTSVEDYLTSRFGALAFLDRRHLRQPVGHRWSRTSPQHIDAAALSRLFPPGFLDASFAVVRDPMERAVSAYHFEMEVERKLSPPLPSFSRWLGRCLGLLATRPTVRDNHLRPMTEMVPENCRLFRLEDELEHVVPWLDELAGLSDGAREIGRVNVRADRKVSMELPRVVPSPADVELIRTHFAADYARFGYALPAE